MNASLGTTKMYLKINDPPRNGACSISPTAGTAMVDKYQVECSGWTDKEEAGIQGYLISCNSYALSLS